MMDDVTYTPLHNVVEEPISNKLEQSKDRSDSLSQTVDDQSDNDNNDIQTALTNRKRHVKVEPLESFDFTETESLAWRRHQFRRFYQSKDKFWTPSRMTNAWKWTLVILTGLLVALTGAFCIKFTEVLTEWKWEACYKLMEQGNFAGSFFALQFFCMFFTILSGAFCWWQPLAAGSGIPELKVYLNGVNLDSLVQMPVLAAKVVAMCFVCATGLPLGKEGPMIHSGSIIGALVSQGNTISIGFDTSWNTFQDFRNDHTKRDYVTYGVAAGVAASFRAPIGGILFAMEEGSSFWSNSVTFRAFMCAVVTQLTMGLLFPEQAMSNSVMTAFGQFETMNDGHSNFYVYELPIFICMGLVGGLFGAFYNYLNKQVSIYRRKYLNAYKWKRMLELIGITFAFSFCSFILPICWQVCTPRPDSTGLPLQERNLIEELVSFQCPKDQYNQLASLWYAPPEISMRQLYHFRELDGQGLNSLTTGPLLMFFIPYYFIAICTSGIMAPAGLFVPTFLSGAAIGRLVGHWLNMLFPGMVADAGTYALIGSAAMLGGVARMTIAGCVICLEACGNTTYLLPLMVTFAAARYSGNAINDNMYETVIHLRGLPFLEGALHTLGMLNYHPISEVMATPVVTLYEVDKVKRIMEVLTTTNHNGFPVISKEGRFRGLVLRKTLCGLIKLKGYSTPKQGVPRTEDGGIEVEPVATVLYDTLERSYPNFPTVESLKLSDKEMTYYLDVRGFLDPSVEILTQETSIRRSYTRFRTMGLRHMVIVDGDFQVVGIVTRADMNEHHLKQYWNDEKEKMQNELNINTLPVAIAYERRNTDTSHVENQRRNYRSNSVQSTGSIDTVDSEVDIEILYADREITDSPVFTLRKSRNFTETSSEQPVRKEADIDW